MRNWQALQNWASDMTGALSGFWPRIKPPLIAACLARRGEGEIRVLIGLSFISLLIGNVLGLRKQTETRGLRHSKDQGTQLVSNSETGRTKEIKGLPSM